MGIDLRGYYEEPKVFVNFEVGKKYHCAIGGSEVKESDGGKQYIQHIIMGMGGEKHTKRFYLVNDKATKFYTSFLATCGIKQEDMADWNPVNLDGKVLTCTFRDEPYDAYDDNGASVTKHSTKLEYFNVFSGADAVRKALAEIAVPF